MAFLQDTIVPHPQTTAPTADLQRASLRRAGPADAVAIRDLTRRAYAKWIPVIGREPLPMGADYEAAVRDHVFALVHMDSALVALIEMRPEPDHLLIVNIAVAPERQGQGLGSALLAHAEALARSLDLPEARLFTHARFTENLKLYARVGYRVDREEDWPGRGVAVFMSKRL